MEVEIKSLLAITTIVDGKINILTKNNNLIVIDCDNDIDYINENYLKDNFNSKIDLKQCYTFCEKESNKLNVLIIYLDIVNIDNFKLSNNYKFKFINNFNNKYTNKIIECIRKEIVLFSTIKKIFPYEFILPDIQKTYESVLETKYDRRNFRKKIIRLGIMEELDKISDGKLGRPAKLYKFKDIDEEKVLL